MIKKNSQNNKFNLRSTFSSAIPFWEAAKPLTSSFSKTFSWGLGGLLRRPPLAESLSLIKKSSSLFAQALPALDAPLSPLGACLSKDASRLSKGTQINCVAAKTPKRIVRLAVKGNDSTSLSEFERFIDRSRGEGIGGRGANRPSPPPTSPSSPHPPLAPLEDGVGGGYTAFEKESTLFRKRGTSLRGVSPSSMNQRSSPLPLPKKWETARSNLDSTKQLTLWPNLLNGSSAVPASPSLMGQEMGQKTNRQDIVSITYEEIGFFPRSFSRVLDRFLKQVFSDVENLVIQEYRFYRYLFLTTLKCVLILFFVPFMVNYFSKTYLVSPLTEYFWNTQQTEIFLNSYQQKRAFTELKDFEEKLYFESLINCGLKTYHVDDIDSNSSILGGLGDFSPPPPTPTPSSGPIVRPIEDRGKHGENGVKVDRVVTPPVLGGLEPPKPAPCTGSPTYGRKACAEISSPEKKILLASGMSDSRATPYTLAIVRETEGIEKVGAKSPDKEGIDWKSGVGARGWYPLERSSPRGLGGFASLGELGRRNSFPVKIPNPTNSPNPAWGNSSSTPPEDGVSFEKEGTLFRKRNFPLYPISDRASKRLDGQEKTKTAFIRQTSKRQDAFEQRLQEKTIELASRYNNQSIEAITNFFADLLSFLTLGYLLIILEIQINITKSFLLEVFFGLDDGKKSLFILLITDLLVGYHSSNLWELFFEFLFNHYGLPESQTGIFLLVATLPVLLDVLFKYLIFRHLNRSSPATVATYHAIIE